MEAEPQQGLDADPGPGPGRGRAGPGVSSSRWSMTSCAGLPRA